MQGSGLFICSADAALFGAPCFVHGVRADLASFGGSEIPVDRRIAAPCADTVRDFWFGAVEVCRGTAALAPHSTELWRY